jgi:hypothetical protein
LTVLSEVGILKKNRNNIIIVGNRGCHLMGLGQLVPDKDNNENLRLLSTMPWIKDLLVLLKDLRYGSVTLVVQDGKVIQMEKVEKIRRC